MVSFSTTKNISIKRQINRQSNKQHIKEPKQKCRFGIVSKYWVGCWVSRGAFILALGSSLIRQALKLSISLKAGTGGIINAQRFISALYVL